MNGVGESRGERAMLPNSLALVALGSKRKATDEVAKIFNGRTSSPLYTSRELG